MNKALLSFLLLPALANAQSWTRIHSYPDSLWTGSINAFNIGDTVIYKGKTDAMENTTWYYVSTNGGQSFQADSNRMLGSVMNTSVLQVLPINKIIIGFKSSPAPTMHKFVGHNNWSHLYNGFPMVIGEDASGRLIAMRTDNSDWFSMSAQGTNVQALPVVNFEMRSSIVRNGRFIIGSEDGVVFYVDNNNFNAIQTATMPADVPANDRIVRKFFVSGGNLYAVCYIGGDVLLKSTDNGSTWTKITTTYVKNGQTRNLRSASTIGTPNGKIYFVDGESSDNNVLVSNDGGATATAINTGLPTPAGSWQELLASGNTVYYNYRVANTTDFVRVDTSKSGLYRLGGTTSVHDVALSANLVRLFPNPAFEALHVSSTIQFSEFRILSLNGAVKKSGVLKNGSLTISDLSAGSYLLQLQSAEGFVTKPFVKQ